MTHAVPDIADVEAYLAHHERKDLLRVFTCGSVDDGKSTLIGRLLYDSKLVFEDQLAAARDASATRTVADEGFDPSLLTDGLKAEREQGITIDVAYRYFSTANRKYIVADTPGHEQYTRNMATGASTCDLAVILIDARHGVVTQTRRHSFIVSLLGIRHVVVAINKMDLVDWSQDAFEQIRADYTGFAARLQIGDIDFIPVSALHGDNVVNTSARMPWYHGATLMHALENVMVANSRNLIDFRFPVQYVNRPHQDFRGYCGTVASGVVRPGDEVVVLPSRRRSRVASVLAFEGELEEAFAPLAVTLTLTDDVDVARGDVLVHPGNLPRVDEKIEAMIVWMAEEPMVPGKRYDVKHLARTVTGRFDSIRYRIDVNTFHRQGAPSLGLNEIGRATLVLNEPLAYDGYRTNRATGAFIVIDRLGNGTVGAGMILDRALDDDRPDHWDTSPASETLVDQPSRVAPAERATRFGQRPVSVLVTGFAGAGKTTLSHALERRLFDAGRAVVVLDGQGLRLGLSRDLGFSAAERSEALRRAAESARLMNVAGLICLCAFVAPEQAVRDRMREVIGAERFLVVHLAAPLEVCRQRAGGDVYARAEAGLIGHFPGVSAPYEPPAAPDLVLETDRLDVETCVQRVIDLLRARGAID